MWLCSRNATHCAPLQGERSFHIFYQLIRGAAKEDRELWKLPDDVSFFKYLDGPNAVTTIDGVDDTQDFQEVRAPWPQTRTYNYCLILRTNVSLTGCCTVSDDVPVSL